MSERRISLTLVSGEPSSVTSRSHERKPSLTLASIHARKPSLTSAALIASGSSAPTRKLSLTSQGMLAAAGGSLLPTRKPSLTSTAMVAAIAVGGVTPSSPRERKPSLTFTVNTPATVGGVPLSANRKPSGHERKPSLASVGIAAIAASGPTRTPAGPPGTPPQPSMGMVRSPSSRQINSSSAAGSLKKQHQLLAMKATRRSFSATVADAHRIELFFHLPNHKELQRLRVQRTLTLIGLQALVQREFGIPFEDQRIYLHGDLLEGDEDLAFYDIHDQSVLNLRVRKRYRPIGDVFTKIKTVQFRSNSLAKTDDFEIVEIVAPLPPTMVVFKRLVTVITYLQRLDGLQAQRTQRRVWKQHVAFWEESAPHSAILTGRRRSSIAPLPVHTKPRRKTSTQSSTSTHGSEADEETPVLQLPPGYVKLNAGPERVSYVVSLAQTHAIAQRLQLPSDQRTTSDLRHVKKWLSSIKFFASASLPDTALLEIARACTYVRFNAGEFLFRQGDIGDHFYILISGCVSLAAYGNGFFATMTPGQCFGEISLFAGNSGLRTASANVNFAAPCAELALLSGEIYRRVINPYKKAVLQTTEKAIYSVPQLRSLPDHIITHIAYASKKLEAKHGRLLIRRGEEMNVLVLLIKGEVKVSVTNQSTSNSTSCGFPIVSVVRAPAVLCQEGVLTNTPAPAPWDVEALDTCTLLCLRADTISIFLSPRQDIIRALNWEHTQRLQEFERRFAQYIRNLPAGESAKNTEKDASSRRRSGGKVPSNASYMRLLASRLFESQRSLLNDFERRSRTRRGAAAHVEFPKILLRNEADSDGRDEDNNERDANAHDTNRSAVTFGVPLSCADLQDEFLHRSLPYGEILDLREQIQFCSFAAHELQEQDHRGRTRALLHGLRQQPVEEVEMITCEHGDDTHFRFAPRPPTSPPTTAPSTSLASFRGRRRNLQTR